MVLQKKPSVIKFLLKWILTTGQNEIQSFLLSLLLLSLSHFDLTHKKSWPTPKGA